jgi:hypothetical protein
MKIGVYLNDCLADESSSEDIKMGLAKIFGEVILWPFKLVSVILCTPFVCGGGILACTGCVVCVTGTIMACTPLCLCGDCQDEITDTLRAESSSCGLIRNKLWQ